MQTEAANFTEQDAQAVGAVRTGDAERYRELVERHERRVYAVAWSRLGDATLAEEATQEAFIRAYRRLWLLGDGAKFAGWIASITRHVAINFGLRHRRELNKRERWALEQSPLHEPHPHAAEADAPCTPETLRLTLAELPDAHRECLVLFYLEGKSGAEAAATLGITESALRVRLHRARAALRERLEQRLGDSLRKLGPAKTLVPAVMAGVLASSSAKAAAAGGAGATMVGALLKSAPLKIVFPFLSFIAFLPGLLMSWLVFRMELRNFRDQRGFRARLFRDLLHRQFLWMVLLFLTAILLFHWMSPVLGDRSVYLLIGGLGFVPALIAGRRTFLIRNRYFIAATAGGLVSMTGCILIGVGLIPTPLVFPVVFGPAILTTIFVHERPIRMDYSLFLRAAEGLLALPRSGLLPTQVSKLNRADLLAFARLLGSRWLANDYRWDESGLRLRLTPVKWSFFRGPMHDLAGWKHASVLLLGWDGSVTATLGDVDRYVLHALRGNNSLPPDLEETVVAAVVTAWECFRAANASAAETALGQASEESVFNVPPAQSGLARWRPRLLMVLLLAILILSGLNHFQPPWIRDVKPVSLTEPEVRAFLGTVSTNPNPTKSGAQRSRAGDPTTALFNCLVLPPTNLFTPDSLRALRTEVFRNAGYDHHSTAFGTFERWTFQTAIVGGWVDWESIGLAPADVAGHLRERAARKADTLFMLGRRGCTVNGEQYSVERIHDLTLNQLRWLRDLNCLDLVDRESLIRQIASVQVLSGNVPPGQPPIQDWRQYRGLFHTPGWPTLQDTYFSVAALEILGGLDRMGREACIKRILKLHRGKGYFTPPDVDERRRARIEGNAHDTLAAFETLRILGALDRVKDLEKWQFRVRKTSTPPTGEWIPWDQIEAWVCQQRLARVLNERKTNPEAPIRSLLEP